MKWKILYFKSFFSIVITALFLGVVSLLSLNASAQSSNTPTQHKPNPINSIIFYYGNHAPLEEMHAFDVAVINDAPEIEPKKYNDANSQLFAYVSVGEALPSQIGPKKIQTKWLMGKNVIGVAAESLFAKWDESQKSYLPVPQPDRDYLLDKFDEVEALGLIPIAIDYVPEHNVPLAKEIAQKISALKIIPYVGNNYLQNVGVSNGSENPDSASALSKRP